MHLSLWWAEAHVYKERNWTPPQWRVGVYGSTAVAGGMVFPKFWGSTATLVGRVCDLFVDSFLLLMSYQLLWQREVHFLALADGVWIGMVWSRYGWASYYGTPKSMQSCGYIEMCVDWKRLLNSPLSIGGMGLKRNGNSVWILLLWTLVSRNAR